MKVYPLTVEQIQIAKEFFSSREKLYEEAESQRKAWSRFISVLSEYFQIAEIESEEDEHGEHAEMSTNRLAVSDDGKYLVYQNEE